MSEPDVQYTGRLYSDAEYENLMTQLCADPIIVNMALALPHGTLLSRYIAGDSVNQPLAERMMFLYQLGCIQQGGEPPAEMPLGAVLEAMHRVGLELGLSS
jgi:hypothetical protein